MLMILPWVFMMIAIAGVLVLIHDFRKEQEMFREYDEGPDQEIIYSISA